MTRRATVALCLSITLLVIGVTAFVPRFTDPPAYFNFADQRTIVGIPNFMDVASNLPWLLIGTLGLWFVNRTRSGGAQSPFADRWERSAFAVLFGGILLVSFGSAYFHWKPTATTLLWDRLPMTVAFMTLYSIVIAERVDARAGRWLFLPLLGVGLASVLYWRYTESIGLGDVRPYLLVQFVPLLTLPLILWLFPRPHVRNGDLVAVIAWYAIAKLFEAADAGIFSLTGGTVSGHSLKHLAGSVAAVHMLRMMMFRRPTAAATRVTAVLA